MLNYRTDIYTAGAIQRMARHYQHVLEQVAADPGVRVGELELLSAAERALVVAGWNDTAVRPLPVSAQPTW
jgi:mycobactin peptide synthetase MbtF